MLFILKPVNVANVFFLALAYLSGDKSTCVPLRLDNIAFILKPVNVANVFFGSYLPIRCQVSVCDT